MIRGDRRGTHRSKDIRGIAVSSALPSLVMVNRITILSTTPTTSWKRATDEVQWLKDNIGEDRIFEISKNRLDDHPALVNLLWERNHRPGDFKRIDKALTIDGFITLKLTGRATCHYSGAAFYGVAYDLLGRTFDRDMLDRIGISPELLTDLYRCEDIVGEVTPAAAEATDYRSPVAAGRVTATQDGLPSHRGRRHPDESRRPRQFRRHPQGYRVRSTHDRLCIHD
jgi:xylulokinase